MRKFWLILLLLVFVTLGVGAYFYWPYITRYSHEVTRGVGSRSVDNPSVVIDPNLKPPVELVAEFDFAATESIFTVDGVDLSNQKINMTFVYPQIMEKYEVDARIMCGSGDVIIKEDSSASVKFVNSEELLQLIHNDPDHEYLFSGICDSRHCNTITEKCTLYIKS